MMIEGELAELSNYMVLSGIVYGTADTELNLYYRTAPLTKTLKHSRSPKICFTLGLSFVMLILSR